MKNVARWTVFTLVAALVWLAGGFAYLALSRHYAMLQVPTLMLTAIFVVAGATAITAIGYAARLDEENDPEETELAARRARSDARGRPQP